jgi:Phosphoglycerate dehydrogenase and related dehydrogenases
MKVLLTSSSFFETKGPHHDFLNSQNFEYDYLKGPLDANELLKVIHKYDAVICGDDEYNYDVLKLGSTNNLKFLSKFGVGLDKIDLESAKKFNIQIANCKSLNQLAVSEHVFALLLSFEKNIHDVFTYTKKGKWNRITGNEINNKTIGILGLGAIGKEVAIKSKAFNLNIIVFDIKPDKDFINKYSLKLSNNLNDFFSESDFVSIHVPLNDYTHGLIDHNLIKNCAKKGIVIINTSRGKIVDKNALEYGLNNNIIRGYLTDVLDQKPMPIDYYLFKHKNVYITITYCITN